MDDFLNQDPVAFNMGSSTLMRMNFELWHCNSSRREGDLDSWWVSLVNVYLELIPFMLESNKNPDKRIHNEFYANCEKAYNSYTLYNKNFQRSSQHNRDVQYIPPRQAYDLFIKWEIALRTCMDEKGLLMKKGDSAAGAMV